MVSHREAAKESPQHEDSPRFVQTHIQEDVPGVLSLGEKKHKGIFYCRVSLKIAVIVPAKSWRWNNQCTITLSPGIFTKSAFERMFSMVPLWNIFKAQYLTQSSSSLELPLWSGVGKLRFSR